MTYLRYQPSRMPIDSDTYLYFDFQETAAPFVNQGSAGTGLNFVDVVGAGTGYQAGVRGPIFGGRGLALDSSSQDAAIRADGTAAWAASKFNVAVWATVNVYVQENSHGQIFFKSWAPTTWADPWHPVSLKYDNSGNYQSWYSPSGSATILTEPRDLVTVLYTPHLLGFSHDGTTLRHYVDGIEVGNDPVATSPTSNLGTGPWCLGNYTIGGSSPLGGVGDAEKIGGIIEEVRVCKVARDADWWLENWQRGVGKEL